MNINHNLTQTDIHNIDVKSALELQIQQPKMKDFGWRFDKNHSRTVYFNKTGELNGPIYVKITLRSKANLNFEKNDKYCFIWSILVSLHSCNNNHPNRVSNYRQNFNELNIECFDFSNEFQCSDVHIFNEVNHLSINIFELKIYQGRNKWKNELIPIQVSKNESDRVIALAIYKNHFVRNKKLDVFLGDHHKKFICRPCLNSYSSENM